MSTKDAILEAYRHRDKDTLEWIQKELTQNKNILDKFFIEYLDVFSDQMSSEDQMSPKWAAYKDKYNESQEISTNLKLTQYYLGLI